MAEIAFHERTPLAEAQVLLGAGGRRKFDSGASGACLSGVRLWGWQIHRLPAEPDEERYLVRADYELFSVPGAPEPATVDVRFQFLTESVSVLDAIPRHVSTVENPAVYTLTPLLSFVAAHAAGTAWPTGHIRPEVPLPAVSPYVEVSGIGGPDLRWRHSATRDWPIRRGAHTGWFVLTVPPAVTEIRVRAHTRFEIRAEDDPGVELTTQPDSFVVRLPAPPGSVQVDTELRLGFAFDVVGYSDRPIQEQRDVQERLAALATYLVRDLGFDDSAVATQSAGDSVTIFLPSSANAAEILPRLLRTTADQLRAGNHNAVDLLRLRMALTLGPIRRAALGWDGPTIVELHRLLDSDAVRDVIRADPSTDLAVIISDTIHHLFVRPRYPGHDPDQFVEALAVVKGFQQRAWLWCPDPSAAAGRYR
jgi:hypothetical protein